MKEQSRLPWLDCIKVFAAFLVVMNHSMSQEWIRAVSENTNISYLLNLAFMLSRASMPLFFMCSGVGMLQKHRTIREIYCKNIFYLLRAYVCWMMVYGFTEIYKMALSGHLTMRTGVNALIKSVLFGQYHTWFIVTLIALYIITPFLQKITSDSTLLSYYISLSILFTILLPYIGKYQKLERLYRVVTDSNMNFVVGYSLYFVLGHYLVNVTLNKKRKCVIMFVFLLSVLAGSLYSFWQSFFIGAECQNVYIEFSILGFLLGVSLFLVFRCVIPPLPAKAAHLMQSTAALGIGIYLLHPLLLPFLTGFTGAWCLLRGGTLYIITFVIVLLVSRSPARSYFLSMSKPKSEDSSRA